MDPLTILVGYFEQVNYTTAHEHVNVYLDRDSQPADILFLTPTVEGGIDVQHEHPTYCKKCTYVSFRDMIKHELRDDVTITIIEVVNTCDVEGCTMGALYVDNQHTTLLTNTSTFGIPANKCLQHAPKSASQQPIVDAEYCVMLYNNQ